MKALRIPRKLKKRLKIAFVRHNFLSCKNLKRVRITNVEKSNGGWFATGKYLL